VDIKRELLVTLLRYEHKRSIDNDDWDSLARYINNLIIRAEKAEAERDALIAEKALTKT